MERQRSFVLKPRRFPLCSFVISSSLTFFCFFFIWVIKTSPFTRKENLALFNQNPVTPVFRPVSVHTLNAGRRTNFSATLSGFSGVSVSIEQRRRENGSTMSEEKPQEMERNGVNASLTALRPSVLNNIETKLGSPEKMEVQSNEEVKNKGAKECDLTKGKWVFDETYPLYTISSCPLIDEGFDCEGNGRLDKDYTKWRWKPQDCEIPRFNATKMLEMMRGKRLVFVGDSINRNQWESLLCMLIEAVPDPKRVYETHGRKITKGKGKYSFKFLDYKCTIEYYVTHFLVHESKARVGQKRVQTLRIDAIDHGSSRWRGADILIFNTAHWWSHSKTKAGINYFQEGDQVHPRLDVAVAFKTAMKTWASWVDKYINRKKTRVLFRSSEPSHFRGGQWNSGGHCLEATRPLNQTSNTKDHERNVIVHEVIKQMKTPVTFLNISSLSDYRIDGHPSVYGRRPRKGQSSTIQDCSHWCLPGLPDTWNQLLYFHLESENRYVFQVFGTFIIFPINYND